MFLTYNRLSWVVGLGRERSSVLQVTKPGISADLRHHDRSLDEGYWDEAVYHRRMQKIYPTCYGTEREQLSCIIEYKYFVKPLGEEITKYKDAQ